MKQLSYLTGFLFASLAAIPASGQTTTNSFPKLWEKPTKTEQETRLDKVPHR